MNQHKPSRAPRRKVSAAGAGGAIAVIVLAVLSSLGVEATPELSAAIATLAAFALAYVVKDS